MTTAILHLRSIADIESHASAWDDLWRRSEVALPTLRAATLAQWLTQFAHGVRFHAIVVYDGDRFLAALPLVERRLAKVLRAGALPSGAWTPSGDLLVDCAADESVFDRLIDAFDELPWKLMWLDWVRYDALRWRRLLAAAARRGLRCAAGEHFRSGLVDIDHDWPAYAKGWSKNHRRAIHRSMKRVERDRMQLAVHRLGEASGASTILQTAFDIEDRGWKGDSGSSVVRSAGVLGFFTRQAALLSDEAAAVVVLLRLDERPIAFEYGWLAKGVYFSFKVGYDPEFAELAPGQWLRHELLKHFFADSSMRQVDFCGPITRATRPWSTSEQPVGRLAIARDGWLARAVVATCIARQSNPRASDHVERAQKASAAEGHGSAAALPVELGFPAP